MPAILVPPQPVHIQLKLTERWRTREEFEALEGISNEALGGADRQLVAEMISEAKLDLHTLNTQITDLQSHLNILQEHWEKAILRVKRLQVWTAPHKDIPSEILARIFSLCLGGSAVTVPPLSSVSMPWVLGRVSSRWREISISEQRLWGRIAFRPWGIYPRAALEEAIRRCGQSMCIELGPIPERFTEAVLPTLRQHRQRLKSLMVGVSGDTAALLDEISSFEQLETLSINYGNGLDAISVISAPPALCKLTLTRDMHGDARSLDNSWIDPKSPIWSHLTCLEITRYINTSTTLMLEILQRCTMLVECTTYLVPPHEGQEISTSIVVPTLQSLRIKIDSLNLAAFLSAITLPSLKVLDISSCSRPPPWPQCEFLGFLERSHCHLEQLSLRNYPISLENVIPLIRSLPDLQHLRIGTETIPDTVVDTIISDALLPKLVFLEASFASSRAVTKLLKSRWISGVGKGIRQGNILVESGHGGGEDGLEGLKRLITRMNTSINITSPAGAI
ncbi:hypothetical protein BDZ94DRAFT_1275843 [Collybia nuda]|uniref:F-box domain-containing protein n=1 Tax=Collybia nuda TaxID=64659 RepID=A0A9P5XVB2_9AGAR|nr:hypothetical protein BDZ94DRAFT_1275843 [Collybia nuda]